MGTKERIGVAQLPQPTHSLESNIQGVIALVEKAKGEKVDVLFLGGSPVLEAADGSNSKHSSAEAWRKVVEAAREHAGSMLVIFSQREDTHGKKGEMRKPATATAQRTSPLLKASKPEISAASFGKSVAVQHCKEVTYTTPAGNTLHVLRQTLGYSPDELSLFLTTARERSAQLKEPVFLVNSATLEGTKMHLGHSGVTIPSGFTRTLAFSTTDIVVYNMETRQMHGGSGLCHCSIVDNQYDALVQGLRCFFQERGMQKAVLGVSGGIDSAVALAIAADALGANNVLAVLLPSPFTSDASGDDAKALAENLGVQYVELPITPLYETARKALDPLFQGKEEEGTLENLQARSRALMLMAIANNLGYTLVNTSNRSELSVGYSTLYGDTCGAISLLGDLYKYEVYALAEWVNREKTVIPRRTIERAPSAELRPNQKDQDTLPDYDTLDGILMLYLDQHKDTKEIVEMGYPQDTVDRVLSLYRNSAFKRLQFPPILRVNVR